MGARYLKPGCNQVAFAHELNNRIRAIGNRLKVRLHHLGQHRIVGVVLQVLEFVPKLHVIFGFRCGGDCREFRRPHGFDITLRHRLVGFDLCRRGESRKGISETYSDRGNRHRNTP